MNSIYNFFVKKLCWSNLLNINSLSFINFTYHAASFIPVFATVILFMRSFVDLTSLGIDFLNNVKLPFSMLLLYLGSVFVLLGKVTFHLCCPSLIFTYKNLVIYTEKMADFEKNKKILESRDYEKVEEDNVIEKMINAVSDVESSLNNPIENLRAEWSSTEFEKPIQRLFCGALSLIGGVFIFVYFFVFLPWRVFRAGV